MAKHPKKPDPKQLGQMIQNIYETGYLDRNTAYKMSFIKGVLSGLGGVIGATLVLALLIWLLSLFANAPLVGRLVKNVNHTINQAQQK